MSEIVSSLSLANLKKAYALLERAVKDASTELERMGAIQCFEFSFELSWKILRKTLIALGKDPLNSPRMVLRDAAENKLIDNPELWFIFLEYRNQTVHTYNEALLDEIFNMLSPI
jgi:nucleotidyltransferase substrate binding protein (TIGR01987 family)